jgi:hypothetical protein
MDYFNLLLWTIRNVMHVEVIKYVIRVDVLLLEVIMGQQQYFQRQELLCRGLGQIKKEIIVFRILEGCQGFRSSQ